METFEQKLETVLKQTVYSTIENDLQEFEKKYQMSSKEFYEQYQSGNLGDDEDYVVWAGLIELKERAEKE